MLSNAIKTIRFHYTNVVQIWIQSGLKVQILYFGHYILFGTLNSTLLAFFLQTLFIKKILKKGFSPP